MRCEQCRLLMQEYHRQSRRYEKAAAEYREAITRGFADEIDATRRRMDEARVDVRSARMAYQSHGARAHATELSSTV